MALQCCYCKQRCATKPILIAHEQTCPAREKLFDRVRRLKAAHWGRMRRGGDWDSQTDSTAVEQG